MRLAERRAARQFWHLQMPWRSCNDRTSGMCLRCMWRQISGKHKRVMAAHDAHRAAVMAHLRDIAQGD